MKNKYIKIIFFILFFIIFFQKNLLSKEFEFISNEIEILENGNLIRGTNGVKVTSDDEIIEADKFNYNKTNLHLELIGNVSIINKSKKISINANQIDYFKKEEKFISNGNVKIEIKDKDTIITGEKINYFKNEEKLITTGDVKILIKNQYIINSSDLTYIKSEQHFFSKNKTILEDNFGNEFELINFDYYNLKNKVRGEKLKYTDNKLNKYFVEDALINLKTNEILGKDLKINFLNSTFDNEDNEPRLKGNKFYYNKDKTIVSKGVFTTCKKTDNCPPWVIQAGEVKHDKINKRMVYKNAWLKIYDAPVVYFPKFFHPDPTVKRQSGFLIPTISDGNSLGSSIEIPYFKAISKSQDLTFTPRLYADGSLILQSEYRVERKNSSHTFDSSFFKDKGDGFNIFKKNNSKNHFFSNSKINHNSSNFKNSKININIETTSNDTYLKTYKIKSPLIKNINSLNSYINYEVQNESTYIKTSVESYENLSKVKSQRYEFVYPNIEYSNIIDLNSKYNGNLNFNLNGYNKNYNSNAYDSILINNLEYESFDYLLSNGVKNKFNVLLKNINSNGENSTSFKEGTDNKLLSSFIFSSTYPLKKEGNKFNSYINPKIAFRYSPSETKNINNIERRIDINNVFATNRIGRNDVVEGGQSITLGSEYKLTNLENNNDYLLFNIATVFRDVENPDLPTKSTIGNKSSDFLGKFKYIPNKNLDFEYNFSLDNSLDRSNYDSIRTSLSINNFITTFEYLNEDGPIGNESYIENKSSYDFDGTNSLAFSTRKNRKTDLTEFYNLIYEYKNDCLSAAIEYNKEYYTDNDLKPTEQLFFKITIIPFGKINSPNIN